MKKFLVIWFMFLIVLSACDKGQHGKGLIVDKGIDRVDLTALYDSIQIKSTESDEKFQELFWIKIRGHEGKIFVNQFCYEDSEIGEVITINDEILDIRFNSEY